MRRGDVARTIAHYRAPTCLAFDNQAKLQMSGTVLQGSTFDNSSEDLGAAHIALTRMMSSCTLAYWNKALLSRNGRPAAGAVES